MELGHVSLVEVTVSLVEVTIHNKKLCYLNNSYLKLTNCQQMEQISNLLRSTKEQLSEENYLPLEELLTDYYDVFS